MYSDRNDTVVNRVGDSGAGEPPRDPTEAPGRARHRARTRRPDHRARHLQAPVPPGGDQGDPSAAHGHPSVGPAHEPQRRQARRLRHPGGEQDPGQRLVACQQPGQLEEPRRVQARAVLGRGGQGRGQRQRLQVPPFRGRQEELPRDYTGSAYPGDYAGSFGSEL